MASRKDEVCFKSFDEALAEDPKTYGRIDLLCGGWPCQDNSIAGKRKGHAGEKSGLFKEFCRVLRVFNPRWFIGENVPGLLSVNAGKDFCEVISELQEIGYGVSWRILDSKYFGVPQQRRRLFIVGYFGNPCPPEILFEQKSSSRNIETFKEMEPRGLCISTRDGQRQDPTTETIVCATIRANDYSCGHRGFEKSNLVAKSILASENKLRKIASDGGNLIAYTINTSQRGCAGRIWEETHIATTNTDGEGKITRVTTGMDGNRGIIIGNAVTVNVAKYIGERIIKYEKETKQ